MELLVDLLLIFFLLMNYALCVFILEVIYTFQDFFCKGAMFAGI